LLARIVLIGGAVILAVMAFGQGWGCTTTDRYPSCVIACTGPTSPPTTTAP
jgi:hypothetical protein